MRKNGFTIIELVIIIVIMGILAVAASITMAPSNSIRLDTAAKKVLTDLQYARSRAFTDAKWYGVSFQTAPTNTYTVYQTDGVTDTTIKDPSRLGSNFVVSVPAMFGGVSITNASIGGGSQVEFSPLGVPYNNKTGTAITTAGTISLSYLGSTKTISITPNTGYIIII